MTVNANMYIDNYSKPGTNIDIKTNSKRPYVYSRLNWHMALCAGFVSIRNSN